MGDLRDGDTADWQASIVAGLGGLQGPCLRDRLGKGALGSQGIAFTLPVFVSDALTCCSRFCKELFVAEASHMPCQHRHNSSFRDVFCKRDAHGV